MTRHLIIIGGQRCGTTYLSSLLADHPQIAMAQPSPPEPKVFLFDDVLVGGRVGYLEAWFSHAGDAAVLGEKSTSYIERPDAIERVRRVLGDSDDLLILAQVRDPVARAVSNWAFTSGFGLEERPLAVALTENLAGPREWDPALTSVSPYAYLERGHYAEWLRPWLDTFGDAVRIQTLEDLLACEDTLPGLYRRLGVDAAHRPAELGSRVNASDAAEHRIDVSLTARLRDYFSDHDDALAALLGRPVPWACTEDQEDR